MIHIIYHNDLDGISSAAIAYKYYFDKIQDFKPEYLNLIPMSYDKTLPFDVITKQTPVIMLDFAPERPGEFQELINKSKHIIWIDHHKSVISQFTELEGKRDSSKAACELTWEYFFFGQDIPYIIKRIGDVDIWKWEFDDSEAIYESLKMRDVTPCEMSWWNNLLTFTKENHYMISRLKKEGETCIQYRNYLYKDYASGLSFESRFDYLKCICINCAYCGSKVFDSIENIEEYDLKVTFNFSGKVWNISLYSAKSEVDCSEIAHSFGGGGHKGAAGFSCKELPYWLK